jgi:hypothetical protein
MAGGPIKEDPCLVVAHGGARIGLRGGLLDVAERDAGIERGGGGGTPEGVTAELPVDSGPCGDVGRRPRAATAG